jgi:hypothetical protein
MGILNIYYNSVIKYLEYVFANAHNTPILIYNAEVMLRNTDILDS